MIKILAGMLHAMRMKLFGILNREDKLLMLDIDIVKYYAGCHSGKEHSSGLPDAWGCLWRCWNKPIIYIQCDVQQGSSKWK